MSIDEARVEEFVATVIQDVGATVSSGLALLGHRLGFYRAMAGAGPLSSQELAERTGTHERYVREWLANQAAGGYVDHDAASDRFELPDEHALVLAVEGGPAYLAPAWEQSAAVWSLVPRLESAFRSGAGIPWHQQDPGLFEATAAFFEPAYRAGLVKEWIPALDGMQSRLEQGARVADVGCGQGSATVMLAEAFPRATVTGFDYHEASIEAARRRATALGLEADGGVGFEVAPADGYPAPEGGYDLVCFFDALHDFGDPVGAARHARESLAPDGAVMLVEIRAGDGTAQNLHPLGRLGYAMSSFVCTPNALSQEGGKALGGQAGPAAIREVMAQAGFSRFRKIADAPIHLVFEARP